MWAGRSVQQRGNSVREQDNAGARGGSSSPSPGAGELQGSNRITGNRRWWALATVMVTMFFASLDQTVVATAMPVIIGDLKGFNVYAWVFTAYLIASAVTVPIYGKLSDVYGRRPFYALGLIVFIIGSAFSGQAHAMWELIASRAVQGIGAGAMMSMPRATIGDIFNPRQRGRWMGAISMTFGLASIIGPFLGGWMTDHLGWRWIFYINLPVASLALLGVFLALPRVKTAGRVSVDWSGTVLLVAGLVPVLLAFTWAGSKYPWGSPVVLGLFAGGALILVLFGFAERRAQEPVIPLHFFKVRLFALANATALLLSVAMFGTLLFLPLYVQGVLQMSAQNSGVVLTPMMLSFIVGALVAGQIMTRTGRYKALALSGAVLMAAGLFLFTRLGADSTWPVVVRNMLVMGIGIGTLLPVLNVAVQNAFPYRSMGVVNAAQQFVRSLGGVVASPILGTLLANTFSAEMEANLPERLRRAFARLPASQSGALLDPQSLINAQTQQAIQQKFSAFGAAGEQLYRQFLQTVHQSLAAGMQRAFWVAFIAGLVAVAVLIFLPEIGLKHDEFYEE